MRSLTIDERRAVARRLLEALCAHYPDRYIALIEQPGSPNPIATAFVDYSMAENTQPWLGIRFPNWPLAIESHSGVIYESARKGAL